MIEFRRLFQKCAHSKKENSWQALNICYSWDLKSQLIQNECAFKRSQAQISMIVSSRLEQTNISWNLKMLSDQLMFWKLYDLSIAIFLISNWSILFYMCFIFSTSTLKFMIVAYSRTLSTKWRSMWTLKNERRATNLSFFDFRSRLLFRFIFAFDATRSNAKIIDVKSNFEFAKSKLTTTKSTFFMTLTFNSDFSTTILSCLRKFFFATSSRKSFSNTFSWLSEKIITDTFWFFDMTHLMRF